MSDYESNRGIGGQSYADHMDLVRINKENSAKIMSGFPSTVNSSRLSYGTSAPAGAAGGMGIVMLMVIALVGTIVSAIIAGVSAAASWVGLNWQWLVPYVASLIILLFSVSFSICRGRHKYYVPELIAGLAIVIAFIASTVLHDQHGTFRLHDYQVSAFWWLPFILAGFTLAFAHFVVGDYAQEVRPAAFCRNSAKELLLGIPLLFVAGWFLLFVAALGLHLLSIPLPEVFYPYLNLAFAAWCLVWPIAWAFVVRDFLPIERAGTTWRAVGVRLILPFALTAAIAGYLFVPRLGRNFWYVSHYFYPRKITGYINDEVSVLLWLIALGCVATLAMWFALRDQFLKFLLGFGGFVAVFLAMHWATSGWMAVKYLLLL